MFTSVMTGGIFKGFAENEAYVKTEARDYYALNFGTFSKSADAQKAAVSLRARGGAGYIHREKSYKVFGMLYLNKGDADKVAKRLKSSGTDVTIYRIEIPSYKLNYEKGKIPVKKLNEILGVFGYVTQNLYSVFTELDSEKIDDTGAAVKVDQIRNKVAELKGEFESAVQNDSTHDIIRLKAELVSLQINLGVISEAGYLSDNFGTEIKYYLLKILFSYQEFVREIK